MNHSKVYVVEDSVAAGNLYKAVIEKAGFDVSLFSDGYSAMAAIKTSPPDIIIQDVCLPDISGIEVLKFAQKKSPLTQVIAVTSNSSIEVAVSAIREGAFDFLEKPFDNASLLQAINNAQAEVNVDGSIKKHEAAKLEGNAGFIGSCEKMMRVKQTLTSAARSKASVLVTGESGTGKEVCAEFLHKSSSRALGPLIAVNCAAIPADLFESEFFGHVKGAFSGALTNREGAVEAANGGTLFLDELCEMALPLQAKLLRFIQTGTYNRVGSSELRKSDVRIVCATNRQPETEVSEGRFREDLFYRLSVIPVTIPPLRERKSDILDLANYFLNLRASEEGKEFLGFTDKVIAQFNSYEWPGNVRELQNVVEKCVVMNDGGWIDIPEIGDLHRVSIEKGSTRISIPQETKAVSPQSLTQGSAPLSDGIEPLWIVEKRAIESAIDICDGNIPVAAVHLGVSASTLYRKIKGWEKGDLTR